MACILLPASVRHESSPRPCVRAGLRSTRLSETSADPIHSCPQLAPRSFQGMKLCRRVSSQHLTGGDGHGRVLAQLDEAVDVVGRQRLLKTGDAVVDQGVRCYGVGCSDNSECPISVSALFSECGYVIL